MRELLERLEGIDEMAQGTREGLPKSAFVFPDRRDFPIQDEKHAILALRYATTGFRIRKEDVPVVIKAVKKRWGGNLEVVKAAKGFGLDW